MEWPPAARDWDIVISPRVHARICSIAWRGGECLANGFNGRMALWLGMVLLGTGIAGWRGRLPGVEPRPYIIRFTEDKPNPLYRRVCYTLAWSALVTYTVLNSAGLIVSIDTVQWRLSQIY